MNSVLLHTKLRTNFNLLLDSNPEHIVLKDINSTYLGGSVGAANLLGFKDPKKLIGITDHQIRCAASERADYYINEDKMIMQLGISLIFLRVDIYSTGEFRTLLNKKSVLRDEENKIIGTYCRSTDVSDSAMGNLCFSLLKKDPLKKQTNNNQLILGKTYYLNNCYSGFSLTKRESECLFYLLRGKSMRDIANIFNLSSRTIESYIEQIKNKMHCNKISEIIEKAILLGFADIVPTGIISKN